MADRRDARKPRCTVTGAGHGGNPGIIDVLDRPLRWVSGNIEVMDAELLDEVPGNQPVRFVPDLSLPHGTEDPIGIPIDLFHHHSVRIRNLIARGFSPLWFPNDHALVVGYRTFHMSLTPVPMCEVREVSGRFDPQARAEIIRQMKALSIESYFDAFALWRESGSIPAGRASVRLLEDLTNAWDQPGFRRTPEHVEFREALLEQFRQTV
jgi:hypothetical protein